jgi:hypothetical protein
VSGTLAELRTVGPDLQEVTVALGLDVAMREYRRFLEDAPENAMTPDAMRRLADLQIEKEFGIRAGGTGKDTRPAFQPDSVPSESDREFEQRTTAERRMRPEDRTPTPPIVGVDADPDGPLEAIAIYTRLLEKYPGYKDSDQVLYQMARAYDELGRAERRALLHLSPVCRLRAPVLRLLQPRGDGRGARRQPPRAAGQGRTGGIPRLAPQAGRAESPRRP